MLCASYQRLTGRDLIIADTNPSPAEALYHAPFVVLSHGTEPDPIFNYANLSAQRLFEMTWAQLTAMPSRLSAEPLSREERAHLLAAVAEHGFIDDYRGVRVSSSGRRFMIEQATVWNLTDAQGRPAGQAATFAQWTLLLAPRPGNSDGAFRPLSCAPSIQACSGQLTLGAARLQAPACDQR
ncbi:MAG: MEKHLA domain-containing protein [Halochromatium sp.]